jgi:hypothetical protein
MTTKIRDITPHSIRTLRKVNVFVCHRPEWRVNAVNVAQEAVRDATDGYVVVEKSKTFRRIEKYRRADGRIAPGHNERLVIRVVTKVEKVLCNSQWTQLLSVIDRAVVLADDGSEIAPASDASRRKCNDYCSCVIRSDILDLKLGECHQCAALNFERTTKDRGVTI